MKIRFVTLVFVLLFVLVGCENDKEVTRSELEPTTTSEPTVTVELTATPEPTATPEIFDVTKESPEDWFIWDDTVITGFTETGRTQKNIVIPAKCTEIADDAFAEVMFDEKSISAMEKVAFANPNTFLGTNVFGRCSNLTELYFPTALDKIPIDCAPWTTKLTTIVLPEKVTEIGVSAFQGCSSLTNITWGTRLACIGVSAFSECEALVELDLPATVERIDDFAFTSCDNLVTLHFNTSLSRLGNGVFMNCSKLTSVVLPDTLEYLGLGVFDGCPIAEIYFPENVDLYVKLDKTIGEEFLYATRNCTVYVKEGSKADKLLTKEVFSLEGCFCVKEYY